MKNSYHMNKSSRRLSKRVDSDDRNWSTSASKISTADLILLGITPNGLMLMQTEISQNMKFHSSQIMSGLLPILSKIVILMIMSFHTFQTLIMNRYENPTPGTTSWISTKFLEHGGV